jgi:ubiquinone/menaquinone biosynthesis C-methylase UbiE
VRYLLGRGEEIPLHDGAVDLVFMSMVFHHFSDPPRVAAECLRVLRGGGTLFLRAGTRDRIPSYPPSRFFPASVPIMQRVLAPAAEITALFEASRFQSAGDGQLEQTIAPTFAAYADQVAAGADSVLVQLAPEQLNAGLGALREHGAQVDPTPVSELIDFFAFRKPDPGRASAGAPP